MVFFFTFGITALIAIGIFSISWAVLASLFFLPLIVLVFGGGLTLWGTYYVSKIGYNKHVRPLLIQHVPMYRKYAAKKDYERMQKDKADGNSVKFALAIPGSTPANESITFASSTAKTNGSAPFSKRALLKSMARGRIVSAGSDKKSTKKGWWRFVNNVDATVYLTKEEKEELAERMKEIRLMRRKKARATSGDDTLSDIENDLEESGAPTSTPVSFRPLSQDVASIIPNTKASEDEEGDEGWGDGVPPYGYDESGKPVTTQAQDQTRKQTEIESESASSESIKSYD